MDAIREIKEEPCLEGTFNTEYQVPHSDFQDSTDFQDNIQSEIKYNDTNLSSAYELASEIDIKDEPYYLNEMKRELEEPQVPHRNLQDEATFGMDSNNDNLLLNGYKIATRTEIEEEHLMEPGTSEDVKCWTILSLDSAPLSQNGIQDTASCITGREVYPKTELLRLPADTLCNDGYETSDFFSNSQSLQMNEISVEYKGDDVQEVGEETFFREVSSSQNSTSENDDDTRDNSKPFKCILCGKNFRYSYYLNRHMVIHSGERPYACDICEKKFTQRSQLKTHKLVHSGIRPHKCELCDMSFTQLGNLKKHLSTHSGSKPYKCDMCDKTFIARSILSRHMLTHSAVKPFKCDICQKRFSDSSVLTRHKAIHSIVHKCDVCGKVFTRKSALSKHKFTFSHT